MNGEIRTYFELEARELVDRLTTGVARLDGSAAPPETLQDLARAAHTLKGAAHVVQEKGMAALAHRFEDALTAYKAQPSASEAARLLHLTDELAAALSAALGASAASLHSAAARRGEPTETATSAANAADADELAFHLAAESTAERLDAEAHFPTIRVDRDETGKLLDQIHVSESLVKALRSPLGELSRIEAELDASAKSRQSHAPALSTNVPAWAARFSELREALEHGLQRLDRQLVELHQSAERLNLVSTDSLLLEAGRIVRSTAAAAGRDVVCVTRGGTDRVDLRIIESLQDALLHLVRNSIVHGIEIPAERTRKGKPATGTITVSVLRSGSDIVLTCTDDGRGIALEPIRQAAVAQKIFSAEEAARASSDTLLALLLRPGFSTRRGSDEMAGRGVGLDVVHTAAERLQGHIQVSSQPGRGTSISLTAPHTLFSLQAVLVSAGGASYALPMQAIEQTFRLQPHHKVTGQGSRTVLLEREAMPYLALEDVMPNPDGRTSPAAGNTRSRGKGGPRTCVVLRSATGPLALAVDRVEARIELLVQPLPAIAGASAMVAGAAFSQQGYPVLVLQPSELFAHAHRGSAQAAAFDGAHDLARPILVIDDSLTTRMLEQSILEAEGYTVDLAVSAEQGLNMARQRPYSLFLVDVEMPGMSGFDFVRAAKADPELGGTPSILVTSLDSAEAREQGRAAGAVSYVVKGEFNQQIYLNRIRAVIRGAN